MTRFKITARENNLINYFLIFLLILYLILNPKSIPIPLLIFTPILQLIFLKKLDLSKVLRIQIIFLLVVILAPAIIYLFLFLFNRTFGSFEKMGVFYLMLLLIFNIFTYYIKRRVNSNINNLRVKNKKIKFLE